MKTTNRTKLDQAPKYVLCLDGILYLSINQGLTGCNLTDKVNEAAIFAHGFDNPVDKVEIWNLYLRRSMNNQSVTFNVKNI